MPRGGRRSGAGRKTNAEIKTVRTLLDQVIPPDRWEELFQTLYTHARKGNMRAAELLIAYRYGDANAEIPPEEVKPIRMVVFRSPDPNAVPYEQLGGGQLIPVEERDNDYFPIAESESPAPSPPPPPKKRK